MFVHAIIGHSGSESMAISGELAGSLWPMEHHLHADKPPGKRTMLAAECFAYQKRPIGRPPEALSLDSASVKGLS